MPNRSARKQYAGARKYRPPSSPEPAHRQTRSRPPSPERTCPWPVWPRWRHSCSPVPSRPRCRSPNDKPIADDGACSPSPGRSGNRLPLSARILQAEVQLLPRIATINAVFICSLMPTRRPAGTPRRSHAPRTIPPPGAAPRPPDRRYTPIHSPPWRRKPTSSSVPCARNRA